MEGQTMDIVIIDGLRTPFGNFGGSLKQFTATDLAAMTVDALIDKTGILEWGKVDSLICGCALGDANTKAIARYIVLQSKLPVETSGIFVEMQCGSAITSLNHAAWRIMAGMTEVAIVGGMESYSTMTAKFPMSRPQYSLIPPYPIAQGLTPNPDRTAPGSPRCPPALRYAGRGSYRARLDGVRTPGAQERATGSF